MLANRIPAFVGALFVGLALSQTARTQQIVIDANSVAVRTGSTPLLRYCYRNVPFKPYVKELYTPSGINVLLDAPPDHLHHHGLMFACAMNNVDFWGEAVGQADGHFEPQPGKQQHLQFEDEAVSGRQGHCWAQFSEGVQWGPSWSPSSARYARLYERRKITVGRFGNPEATVLTWDASLSEQTNNRGRSVLTGSHYHGLGMRFVRAMDATGEFRNPDNDPGVIFRGEERLVRSRWCAYTAKADGKTVTVAMFDSPENPRHPATWFTMAKPFAYMSATLRLHEEPLRLVNIKNAHLRYGVALWDGRPEIEQIETLYKRWVKKEWPELEIR